MSKFSEPWKASNGTVTTSGGLRMHYLFGYEARIVACVNACEGIEDPEDFIKTAEKAVHESAQIVSHRDELLAALESIAEMRPVNHAGREGCFRLAVDTANRAVLKVKGGGHE
jgi:hypothetical protein